MSNSVISNILNNPNPKTDFVQVYTNLNANGDINLDLPNNLLSIARARGIPLRNMNVIIVYLGSTISAGGNINLGCSTPLAQDIPNSIISPTLLSTINTILANPNPNTDYINLNTNMTAGGNIDFSYDFSTAQPPSGKFIPWRNMNIIFASIKNTPGPGHNLNITFPCTNKSQQINYPTNIPRSINPPCPANPPCPTNPPCAEIMSTNNGTTIISAITIAISTLIIIMLIISMFMGKKT